MFYMMILFEDCPAGKGPLMCMILFPRLSAHFGETSSSSKKIRNFDLLWQ